jgi:L-serine/L-threonine ammonia-lyase
MVPLSVPGCIHNAVGRATGKTSAFKPIDDAIRNMQKLHIETPVIESVPLSQGVKGIAWLKMDALQPSGSFKLRGIGNACQKYRSNGAQRFISSSGGNAGIAVAYSGRKLRIPVTVVVPESTTQRAIDAIRQENADVIIKGKTWQEAHTYSVTMTDRNSVYIHPFDDPLIWAGHSTIIDEVVQSHIVPDVVVLSVGGGGLLCGIIEGLKRHDMANVPILAVETCGADSLAASMKAGRHVELPDIKSIATSLGAKKVAAAAYELCHKHDVISHVVSDKDAVDACMQFSIDHRLLVEPACGASLSTLYNPVDVLSNKENILVIVCGGAGVTCAQLDAWKKNWMTTQ